MAKIDLIGRAAIFTLLPPLLALGFGFVVWFSIYFTIPLVLPFAAYMSDYRPTIFNSWVWSIASSIVLGGCTALFSNGKPFRIALATYFGCAIALALVVHLSLNFLGYRMAMEMP